MAMVNSQVSKGLVLRLRKNRWLDLLLILVILVGGLLIYQGYSARADRQKFIRARAAIDTIYADIMAKVGRPDNYKRTNDCSRPNQEFTQGPLSCSVGIEFIYGVGDETQANSLFKQIQGVIAAHPELLKTTKPLASAITDTLVVNTYYRASSDNYSIQGLRCVVNYVFDTPEETNLTIKNASYRPLEITLGCHGPAKKQYFSSST